jgi:hypothetical protein
MRAVDYGRKRDAGLLALVLALLLALLSLLVPLVLPYLGST